MPGASSEPGKSCVRGFVTNGRRAFSLGDYEGTLYKAYCFAIFREENFKTEADEKQKQLETAHEKERSAIVLKVGISSEKL